MRERSSLLLLLSLSEQKQKLLQVKLVLPAAAALPLLVAYGGGTGVSIPHPLFRLLKNVKFLGFSITSQYLELGWIYKAYMAALVIFCTNAINILAGVNGLEAGQTAVTAAAVAAHNLGSIASLAAAAASPAKPPPTTTTWAAVFAAIDPPRAWLMAATVCHSRAWPLPQRAASAAMPSRGS